MSPRFSLLILTHNRLEAVEQCFTSLDATMLRDDVETLVLDNFSTDGTREYLQALPGYPGASLFCKSENVGVAAGRAFLLSMATGERIVFLDSDTVIVDQRWLDDMDRVLDNEAVGVVGPGGSFVLDGWAGFTAGRPGEVDCVAGYCTMIKAELFRHGLTMDTSFARFWCEDSDLNFAVRDMGYDVMCVPVGVMHMPAHSGYGQEAGLHEANFERLRQKWQGKGLVRCEGGY